MKYIDPPPLPLSDPFSDEDDDGRDPREVVHQRVGALLRGKWRIDGLLGVGGAAAVYSARHRNGRRVAIKVLHPELSVDREARTRFLREGYFANQVNHPGILVVLDDDVAEDGSVFLVLELLDGESLQARWARKGGMLAPTEVLSIADQLLDVLAVAHDRGVVHRDIKPANLFLTRQGMVKLLDFGLARLPEAGSPALTQHNLALGTPAFMPPEQALGQDIDHRTDLWAVGATMLTLLCGRHVHHAATVNEVLLAAMTTAAPPSRDLLPGLPASVSEVIDTALRFRREDRFPDARAMQRAVREAYYECGGIALEQGCAHTVRPSHPAGNSRRDWLLAAALFAVPVLLSAVLGMAWGTIRGSPAATATCDEPSRSSEGP